MEPSCTHYFRRDSEQGQPLRYGAWRSWFTRRRCINILLSCKRRKLPRPRADMCHDEFPGTMLNECYYTKWCLFHIAKRLPEHTVTRLTLRPCRLPRRNSSPKENETIMLGLTLWRRRQRDFPQSLHRFNPWPSSTGAQTLPLTPPPPCPHPSELIKILNQCRQVRSGLFPLLHRFHYLTRSPPLMLCRWSPSFHHEAMQGTNLSERAAL